MTQTLKEKLSVTDKWIRLIFMVLFAIVVYFIAITLIWLIAIFQFLYTLFVGKPNSALLPFSEGLSIYIQQIMAFVTYVKNEKPFPFSAWPHTHPVITKEKEEAKPKPKAKITEEKEESK
ncbi:MAG: DUF4389 domain-containing protein [Gammaproteobacteria bacterium]|nr:DUF4389 domain-containing protein [Gammaproteobacteria bacterium]